MKIKYHEYIVALKNTDCSAALLRIVPKIDMDKINSIIDSVEAASDIRKQFLKTLVAQRKKLIIDAPYRKLLKMQSEG